MSTADEFHKEHGPDYVIHNGRIYYCDGAWRENVHFGGQSEPPTDPYQRQEAIIRFHELHLQNEIRRFEDLQKQLTHIRYPTDFHLAVLQEAKDVVEERLENIAVLREELDALFQNRPEIKARLEKVNHAERQWIAAKADLNTDDSDDAYVHARLQAEVHSAARTLHMHCRNLQTAGGRVPAHLQAWAEEVTQRAEQQAEDEATQLRNEIRKMQV